MPFQLRTSLPPSTEEINRQEIVWSVLRGASNITLTTMLEKKAAAICHHARIDSIMQCKVLKSLETIKTFIKNEDDLNDVIVQRKIWNYLKTVEIEIGDVMHLSVKPLILTRAPQTVSHENIELETAPNVTVSLHDFETLCFENRVQLQYYTNTPFSSYVFQNILFSLSATTLESLLGSDKWQARLATLIHHTGFSDIVTIKSFYEDTVEHNGVVYDTSFVPKYEVRKLKPIARLPRTTNDPETLNYREKMDPRNVKSVPLSHIGIFLVYPFKDGYYVQPDGTVTHVGIMEPKKNSIQFNVTELCDASNVEHTIDDAARTFNYDDVLAYAIHSVSLKEQGLALLIIRQMIGPVLTLGEFKISLPTIDEILAWTSFSCTSRKILLPEHSNTPTVAVSNALIRDIASSCVSKLGAAFICSSYNILESDFHAVYGNLRNDAELYVFLTLLMQVYPTNMYKLQRDSLKPVFGSSPRSLERYQSSTRAYVQTTLADRLNSYTEPLITPTDVGTSVTCPPYKCMELYEFIDPKLNELVTTGDTELTPSQYASFISLHIQQTKRVSRRE
ncbi:OrNVorf25-like [Venturia canescens]|uniref:OrNVorf25-like n=1 Tax=Venturia canescens TaxID=32260 RepID=A0ACB9ZHT3_9HYME|nr:uncharacterized LOC122408851 [Venturia canescens]KAI5630627.1 OrNVorf25-like [Venturia canescens]